MAKKRVFISFDFDNDKKLKEFIVGQSRLPDSPFEIIDTSLKEAAPMKTWEDKASASSGCYFFCSLSSGSIQWWMPSGPDGSLRGRAEWLRFEIISYG